MDNNRDKRGQTYGSVFKIQVQTVHLFRGVRVRVRVPFGISVTMQ